MVYHKFIWIYQYEKGNASKFRYVKIVKREITLAVIA